MRDKWRSINMKDESLQLFSFEVNKENIINKTIYLMKFPKELKDFINMLKELKAKEFGYTFALKGLEKIAKNYCRNILTVNSSHYELIIKDNMWIYSTEKFDTEGLKLHISEWINTELKDKGKLKEEFFLKEDLQWECEIASSELFEGNYKVFDIIPQLYGRDMCKSPIYFKSIGESFQFYPLIKNNGINLITEPIFKKNKEPFSYCIYLSLKAPYKTEGKYFLNIELATKIWINGTQIKDKNYITKENTSLYVFKKDEFVDEQELTFIQCDFTRAEEGAKWSNSYDKLYCAKLELDINKIVRVPEEYLDFKKEVICLITNKNKKSATKRGAGIAERAEIFTIFNKMYRELIPRDKVNALKIIKMTKNTDIREVEELKEFHEATKISSVNKKPLVLPKGRTFEKLEICIYSDNKEILGDSIKISRLILGLEDKNGRLYTTDGVEVCFILDEKSITRELIEGENKRERLKEIQNEVSFEAYDNVRRVALVDIPAYHAIRGREKFDSKSLVRLALKSEGILTQFINGYDDEEKYYKLKNALYDLFFVAGFLNKEFYDYGFENKILIGVDFIPGCKSKLLVMSKVHQGKVYYKLFNDKKWQESSYFIKNLDKDKLQKAQRSLKEEVVDQWVWDSLEDEARGSNQEIYFYIDASLRSSYWKFMKNDKFDLNNVKISNDNNNIKFIRINNTDEVPDYLIGNESNLKKGLFSNDMNVFYMVGAKSDTFMISSKKTKYDKPGTQFVKQRLCEMVILGEDKEKNYELARESYLLRRLIPTYEKEVALPLPMYIVGRLSEYVNAVNDI
jgi:hypothetical protein